MAEFFDTHTEYVDMKNFLGFNGLFTENDDPTVRLTRSCLICGTLENQDAQVFTEEQWICTECAKKIGKLIGVRTDV